MRIGAPSFASLRQIVSMSNLLIRPATPDDCSALAWMCHLLWPDASAADHARELAPILSGHWLGSLPVIFFLAQHHDGRVIGFIQVGLRSHADGSRSRSSRWIR